MFRDDSYEPLQATQDRPVDDDWPARRLVGGIVFGGTVLQVEAFRQLEVKLDRRALERPAERVADGDVDLGPIERAIARIEVPLAGIPLVECALQLPLGLVPRLDRPKVVVGARRELELELEPEEAVDML